MTIDEKITRRGRVESYLAIDCAACDGGAQVAEVRHDESPDEVARRYGGFIAGYGPLNVCRSMVRAMRREADDHRRQENLSRR